MKRKWFTLLFAFLALASFQVNAQTKYLIYTADTTANDAAGIGGTKFDITSTAGFGVNPHYAELGSLDFPGKLTKDWKWEDGPPANTDTRFEFDDSPGANFTRIFEAGTTNCLRLKFNDEWYDKFIIFQGDGGTGFQIPSNWMTSPCGPTNWAGFLSINTAINNQDDNLVIVLVNTTTGDLELNTIEFLIDNIVSYAPFAFYACQPQGHWAREADFPKTCKYYEFPNLFVTTDSTVAKIAKNPVKATNIFAVTQVDWIGESVTQSGANMFGNASTITPYNTKFALPIGGGQKGLEMGATYAAGDNVIPLFTLASPENGCGVVSVSRQNDLDIQSQTGLGVYANKLELRDFGTYWSYKPETTGGKTDTVYKQYIASSTLEWDSTFTEGTAGIGDGITEVLVATSLQKFAIWIDEDGNYTLYPAASYAWAYGNDKRMQLNTVLPNSVLMYNNLDITEVTGGTPTAEQGWGTKIGEWNGKTTSSSTINWTTATIPNALQNTSDYRKFEEWKPACNTEGIGNLEGKYFFLKVVDPDVKNIPVTASRTRAYQENGKTEYVLSTRPYFTATGSYKRLYMLPKEKVRGYADATGNLWYPDLMAYKKIEGGKLLPDYWANNPYDSVNMAAHWQVINKGTLADPTYMFINMLGDTLQYRPLYEVELAGGFVPQNELMAEANGSTSGFGFFNSDAGEWFEPNTIHNNAGTALNLWTASAIPGGKGFVLTLEDGRTFDFNGTWELSGLHAKKDSVYYQGLLRLPDVTPPTLPLTPLTLPKCAGGLMLQLDSIYYVPTYSGSFNAETRNGVINTNDPSFKDGVMERDSLTAYLHLNGTYAIVEAAGVNNDLKLGIETTEFGAFAAALTTKGDSVTFIPLAATSRIDSIREAIGTGSYAGTGVDTLYNETYKWFLVKKGDQYLQFDTIAPTAPDDNLKVGFTFGKANDIANATPVRLYQPLVGDKLQGNFIFQFQIPFNTYYPSAAATYTVVPNDWPELEGKANPRGYRAFGRLSTQSKNINATFNRALATRFTYSLVDGPTPKVCCEETFITPDWMAGEKLLSMPVNNKIWDLTLNSGEGALINFGMGNNIKDDAAKTHEAIIVKEADGITELKHIYVGSIKSGDYTGTPTGTFVDEIEVPLYMIQGSYTIENKPVYLTVDSITDQFDTKSTEIDVTGVKLKWDTLYTDRSKYAYDIRHLQLFAISGAQDTADVDNWYAACRPYVYLPLASYKVDYSKGEVLTKDGIFYNKELGRKGKDECSANDVTTAYRIGQYSRVGGEFQHLIVANSAGATSIVPVEFKWQPLEYDTIGCDYQLIQNARTKKYYTSYGADLDAANQYTLPAHWTIKHDAHRLHTIDFEEFSEYGASTVALTNSFGKEYYFKIMDESEGSWTVRAFDFSNYNSVGNYAIKEDTFVVTCTPHDLPFFNLEELGETFPAQFAILEVPFLDRNLSDSYSGGKPTPIPGKNSFQVYLDKFANGIEGIKDAVYLKAYKTNERRLDANTHVDPVPVIGDGKAHIIPYYVFSLAIEGGKEYFLNVAADGDSVYWTAQTDLDAFLKVVVEEWDADDNWKLYPTYKFCLPYQVNEKGELDTVYEYQGVKCPPVYLQTLDTTATDYPYLVVAGAATRFATAVRLDNAMLDFATSGLKVGNIYTVNYAEIDSYKVTSWILGGKAASGKDQWVPLTGADGEKPASTEGVFAVFKPGLDAVTFITNSGQPKVDYGVLTGVKESKLYFNYVKTDTIGSSYAPVEIYYYNIGSMIGLRSDVDAVWMTDYRGSKIDTMYTFGSTDYQYAYFIDELMDKDPNFIQTFGLRYVNYVDDEVIFVDASESTDKTFVVVSNAGKGTKEDDYRFLAAVNNRLVFVKGKANALVFQYGKAEGDDFVGIPVVGAGEVFGVSGGVRLLNQAGNVVNVYSVDGSLLKTVQVTSADQTVVAPRGIVIVKSAGKATKVVVK